MRDDFDQDDHILDAYEGIDPDGYRHPAASKASRSWNRKTEHAGRHSLVTPWNQEFHCESTLELKAFLALMADVRVRHVAEQPAAIEYPRDGGGKPLEHTVDMVATMHDGTRVAVLVKPRSKAAKAGLPALIHKLAEHAPPGFADSFVHVHEGHLTKDVVRHGALVLTVLRDGPFPEDAVVGRLAEVVSARMTVRDAVATARMPDAFRAVVRLVADGRFRVVKGCVADLDALIEPVRSLTGSVA